MNKNDFEKWKRARMRESNILTAIALASATVGAIFLILELVGVFKEVALVTGFLAILITIAIGVLSTRGIKADLITGFSDLGRRIDNVAKGMETVGRRMEGFDGRMESVEKGTGSLDRRMESLDGRMESVEKGIGSLDRRMESLDKTLKEIRDKL